MSKEINRYKGFVLGAVGGAVGVLAMQYYWKGVAAVTGSDPREASSGGGEQKEGALADISLVGKQHKEGESSTEAAGRHEYELFTGKEPKAETKSTLSMITHWGFGMTAAALYGALRGSARIPDIAGGLALAVGLWGLGDELAVPLLGLAKGPTSSPPELHAYTLGAHMAYGLAAAATAQVLDKVI